MHVIYVHGKHKFAPAKIMLVLSSTYLYILQSTLDGIVLSQMNAKHDNSTRFRQHEH